MRMQKKPNEQAPITNALENAKPMSLPQEAHKRALHITNEAQSDYYTSLSFSNASSSLEVIQKAQMEQVQRRNHLDIAFPEKLHDILRDEAFSNIITWLPHGQAFQVLDKKKFEEVVSTKFFNGSCYSSFTKKLNRWNFVRILTGPDVNSYKHKVSY